MYFISSGQCQGLNLGFLELSVLLPTSLVHYESIIHKSSKDTHQGRKTQSFAASLLLSMAAVLPGIRITMLACTSTYHISNKPHISRHRASILIVGAIPSQLCHGSVLSLSLKAILHFFIQRAISESHSLFFTAAAADNSSRPLSLNLSSSGFNFLFLSFLEAIRLYLILELNRLGFILYERKIEGEERERQKEKKKESKKGTENIVFLLSHTVRKKHLLT